MIILNKKTFFVLTLFVLLINTCILAETPTLNSGGTISKEEATAIATKEAKRREILYHLNDCKLILTFIPNQNYKQNIQLPGPGTIYVSDPPTAEQKEEIARRDELNKIATKPQSGNGYWSVNCENRKSVGSWFTIDGKTGDIGAIIISGKN